MSSIPLIFAFSAGIVSFISPCILPLIPGYLIHLSGNGAGQVPGKRKIFLASLAFVLGFSLVFALLGVALNTVLESVAYDAQVWLARIGGIIIIFFALLLLGVIKINFFQTTHTAHFSSSNRYLSSFLFGIGFAAGWTPCVGAVLGGILGLASSQPGSAFGLLLAYALGLGIPFLVIGLFAGKVSSLIERSASYAKTINIIFASLLLILGILVFTQTLNRIANFESLFEMIR